MFKRLAVLCSAVALAAMMGSVSSLPANAMGANSYHVTRLVADEHGHAAHTDANLVNAWGLAAGPTTPWWVANNETDTSTLYDGTGSAIPLVVHVNGAPTGTVYNGSSAFVVSHNGASGPSVFLFAGEDGRIRGWNPTVGPGVPSTRAFFVVGRAFQGAVFKGLTMAQGPSGPLLYATDFHNGRVDVFNGSFHQVMQGSFQDPNIPARFRPFGIQELGGNIFVTYAMRDPATDDDVAGFGLGFVDMYDTTGHLLERVATRHVLNAPWGLAWAPAGFGAFSGDLLVGNFGNGLIHVFKQETDGSFRMAGALRRASGRKVWIDGLWALGFGNGSASGPVNSLYFTAGPDDEAHGLFGVIAANP